MGYGKKMDYATGKTVDLDKVYKTIIQPVVASAGYRCVRGDEVKDPSLIDRSMYALLMHAELVIPMLQHLILMLYMSWGFGML